jgi:hypothetical protein
MIIDASYIAIKLLYKSNGYEFLEKGINVFGIRSKDRTVDKWNDVLGIAYDNKVIAVSGTTDPGASPLSKTEGVNKNGIFILQPGFYKNCLQKGKHKGKYNALVQFGSVFRGWRDADRDGQLDMVGQIWTDVQGLNFHTTRWDKQVMRVGDFSEACQVCEVATEYDLIMDVVYASTQSLFNYALFDEN